MEAVERIFLQSTLLSRFACSTVMTGPILPSRKGRLSELQGFLPEEFPEIPVHSLQDPWVNNPEGLKFFREIYRKRTSDLPSLLTDAHLERLGWASGGLVREFMHLIQEVALNCQNEVEVATDKQVEEAIDYRRRLYEAGLHKGHFNLLN